MIVPAIRLQPLLAEDIAAVVRLHREALGYSLNSKLGAAHLARVYAAMRCEPSSTVVTVKQDGAPVGVVSATLDPERLRARLVGRLTLRQQAALAARLAASPGLWRDWMEGMQTSRPARHGGSLVRPCLTSIAVAPVSRRAGLGTALVGAVEDFFRRHGCAAYYLDTRADNAASRAFYERLGFVEVERRGRAVVLVKELARGAGRG